MAIAADFQQVTPELFCWSAYAADVKCDLNSCAYRYKGGLIFVDPIQLEESALQELLRQGEPRAILLTNENHERAADWYRKKFKIPICASALASPHLELKPKPEVFIQKTDVLYGLTPIPLLGATHGETAFWSEEGVLMVGDALINLEPQGLTFLPDKYCLQPEQNRASLQRLLDWPVQLITFAHGWPLRENAAQRLQQLFQG
jgi:glyoxylase-like metal-dependent hydrolase (beta-lactamase superfamily II)